MSLVLAANKGRSGSKLLQHTLREAAAHSLCTGSVFICRWIPSESNISDGPSRGFRPGGASWSGEGQARPDNL
eukprot:12416544-Karenia_brevis.AAC.1